MGLINMNNIFIIASIVLLGCQNKDFLSDQKKTIEVGNNYQKQPNIIGKWITPHNASLNITFYNDNTFVFNDYNTKKDKEEVLKGKYSLQGTVLTLKYYDRKSQNFSYTKGKGIDTNYYITKKGYYFVKSD
ncbi:hypothetical protein J3D55_003792 [Chryseobacterium ginsenosidimutans]|uniref:hypothetical protein n=1 Tax=Chryseobacterium ginsenosidimutans TaxID=687846 RepID=UPI00216A483D|nr:hypothetical protein [Chryseobacterium ginsenosidimutans]MCS3870876.1 hypothetical protein [Chryseobacterium ginsenosidimutans]